MLMFPACFIAAIPWFWKTWFSENYRVDIVKWQADGFHYLDFSKSLAKFVRANHVDSSNHHWMFTATEENELSK